MARVIATSPTARRSIDIPHLILAVLPLLVVLGANYVLSRSALSVATWYPEEALRSTFPTLAVKAVVSSWALIVALVLGIATTILVHAPRVWGRLTPSLSAATSGRSWRSSTRRRRSVSAT